MATKYPRQAKYDSNNTQFIGLKLNKKTDVDILAWLNDSPAKQTAIKQAIRSYIAKEKLFTAAKRTAAEKVFTGTAYDPAVMISETADADESIKTLVSEEKFVEFWTNYFTGKLADLSKGE